MKRKLLTFGRYTMRTLLTVCMAIFIVCFSCVLYVDGRANALGSWLRHDPVTSLTAARVQLGGFSWLDRFTFLAFVQSVGGRIGNAAHGRIYADAQAGATADAKLTNAIGLCPTAGCVVDAVGISGSQTIAATVNLSMSGEL